ncbi:MAG: sigma-70 family RNA polymerase sigma factor [Planctomycetota bacterium]|nr:MAG: sigma-70 family RNA polymerase sigma factor [Planctomycetota bacterium]
MHPSFERDRCAEFVRLFAAAQRRLFLYALSLLHDPVEAEEVVQSASVVLWQKFDDFAPDSDFTSWACRVLYYEILKWRERRAKQGVSLSPEFLESLADEASLLLNNVDRRRDALHRCLAKLRPRDREMLLERYRDGNTTETIAERYNRTVGAVRRALHRLRMSLVECIRREMAQSEHP